MTLYIVTSPAHLRQLSLRIQKDEGFRPRPYVDTAGNLTIGYGRNLTANDMSESEGSLLMMNDIDNSEKYLIRHVENYAALDAARKMVLICMCFQLGIGRLLGFKKMFAAIAEHNWQLAAQEMLDSNWGREFVTRAMRLAGYMENGVFA